MTEFGIPSTTTSVPLTVGLDVAPSGAAILVWVELTDSAAPADYRGMARYRSPDGTWGVPIELQEGPAGQTMLYLSYEIAENGDAVAVWETDGRPYAIVYDGIWRSVRQLSTADTTMPNAAIDASGNATVVWRELYDATNMTVVGRSWSASTDSWSGTDTIMTVGGDDWDFTPQIAVNATGRAVVAARAVGGHTFTSTRPSAGGGWTAPVQLETDGTESYPMSVFVTPDGTSYVAVFIVGTPNKLALRRAAPGGAFGARQDLVNPFNIGPAVMMSSVGDDLYVGWSWWLGGGGRSFDATRWLSGAVAPEPPVHLGDEASGQADSMGVDADGSVVLFARDSTVTWAAPWDAGGPRLMSSSVPASVQAGASTPLTASFADGWSTVAGVTWSFGDGTSDSGAAVSKTWDTPGAYVVTATAASDALGNVRVETFPVTVSASPAPGGGGGSGGGSGGGGAGGGSGTEGGSGSGSGAGEGQGQTSQSGTEQNGASGGTGGTAGGGGGGIAVPKDRVAPAVAISEPKCPKSRKGRRCLAFRKTRAAWRLVTGTVKDAGSPRSGVARVELVVYRKDGKRWLVVTGQDVEAVKSPAAARRRSTKVFVKFGRWSRRLPRLTPGTWAIRYRAVDKAGNASVWKERRQRMR